MADTTEPATKPLPLAYRVPTWWDVVRPKLWAVLGFAWRWFRRACVAVVLLAALAFVCLWFYGRHTAAKAQEELASLEAEMTRRGLIVTPPADGDLRQQSMEAVIGYAEAMHPSKVWVSSYGLLPVSSGGGRAELDAARERDAAGGYRRLRDLLIAAEASGDAPFVPAVRGGAMAEPPFMQQLRSYIATRHVREILDESIALALLQNDARRAVADLMLTDTWLWSFREPTSAVQALSWFNDVCGVYAALGTICWFEPLTVEDVDACSARLTRLEKLIDGQWTRRAEARLLWTALLDSGGHDPVNDMIASRGATYVGATWMTGTPAPWIGTPEYAAASRSRAVVWARNWLTPGHNTLELTRELRDLLAEIDAPPSPWLSTYNAGALRSIDSGQVRLATARALLALEKFWLTHGRVPASTTELGPAWPADPLATGTAPMSFAPLPTGGYRIWSAARDGPAAPAVGANAVFLDWRPPPQRTPAAVR
jgi:hypothetical protein